MPEAVDPLVAWARSGAMWLTGDASGPLVAIDAPVAIAMERLGRRVDAASAAVGTAIVLDWAALLGERAAIAGLTRSGRVSAGGSCRLVQAVDGWIAVNLARPSDLELLPAWLGTHGDGDDAWDLVAAAAAT